MSGDVSTTAYLLSYAGDYGIYPSAGDAVAAVLGEPYAAIEDENERMRARWESAVATANQLQAVSLVEAAKSGRWSPAGEQPGNVALLFQDKRVPYDVTRWDHPLLPLVAIAEDYSPFTERPKPTGNLRWIAVGDDRSFLETLDALGVIAMRVEDTV